MQFNWLEAELELGPPAPRRMINSQVCGRLLGRRASWLVRAQALLRLWRQRMHQRAELARLATRDLRDIGLSEADVWAETEKWFWQE